MSGVDLHWRDSDGPRPPLFHVPHTVRPPGADTQWIRFRFRSDGLLTHSPGSHVAVVLRARLGCAADGTPQTISGRGIALGDTSAATPLPGQPLMQQPGFGGARGATVESFWPGGNFLYRQAAVLPGGLEERRWYLVEVQVDDARWIAFRIAGPDGRALHDEAVARVRDAAAHPVIADASGVLLGLGRDLREHGGWSAEVRDIRHGWCSTPPQR